MTNKIFAKSCGIVAVFCSLVLPTARADTFWTAGNADFNNPTNWSAGIPNSSVNAIVNNGGTVLIQAGDPTFQTFDIRAGDGAGNSGHYIQDGPQVLCNSWFRIGIGGGTGDYLLKSGSITSARFIIGDSSTASFTMTNTAATNSVTLSTDEVWCGEYVNGNGTINLGGNASFNVNSWVAIGRDGSTGVLNMSGNAVLNKGGANVITLAGLNTGGNANGTINQSGNSAINSPNNDIWLGETHIGVWNLSGGSATVANLRFGVNDPGATGSVNLTNGTLAVNQISVGQGAGTLNFAGGTLRARSANVNFMSGVTGIIQAGGAVIDSQGFNIGISSTVTDGGTNGNLTKLGSGTLVFSGNLPYSGATTVSNGTVIITIPTTFGSAACNVASGATFGVAITSSNAQLSLPSLSLSSAGCALNLNFTGYGSQTNPPIHVNTLAANGPTTINIAGVNFVPGQFPLVQYNSKTGGGSFALGAIPIGMTAQLTTNTANKSIDLVITGMQSTIGSITTGYWQFSNSTNLGLDSSGLGNQLATASGTPIYSNAGKFGGALYLDGNSTMSTPSGLFPVGVPVNASPYSIAVWEKVDTGCPNTGGFVGWGASSYNQGNNFRLNGFYSLDDYWYNNDFVASGLSANPMDGNWHAVAVTWDGTNQIMYMDGVAVGSRNPTSPAVQGTGFEVGGTTADVNFKGWLNDLLIANAAMTPAELAVFQTGNWSATLTTYALQPTASPTNSVFAGTMVTLNVLVAGTPPYNYQWQKNGTNIIWGTLASLVLTNAQVGDSGNYSVIVSNSSGTNSSAALIVTIYPASAPLFTQHPAPAAATNYIGGLAIFTAGVNGTPPIQLQWQHNGTNLANATGSSLTLPSLQPAAAGSYTLIASNAYGVTNSLPAVLSVISQPNPSSLNVLTYHNDNSRQGVNTNEVLLTTANVNVSTFGRLLTYPTDGFIYAQPLYVSGLTIPGQGTHNVVFVATENDSLYAFDADSSAGTNGGLLWHANLGTAVSSYNNEFGNRYQGTYYGDIVPLVGITGTPVIDLASGTLYVDVFSREVSATTNYYHRIHALNITNGFERAYSPVTVTNSVPGKGIDSVNGVVTFNARTENQRPGMTLAGGMLYAAYGSFADTDPYHGWVMGFKATNLAQSASYVFNVTPNASVADFGANAGEGALWMGGNGLCVDASNNLYFVTGNGSFSANTNGGDYSDSYVKLSTTNRLAVADYFTPYNQADLATIDADLGSGGTILLPDSVGSAAHPHLMAGAGKDGVVRLVDRDNMGHYNSANDNQIVQEVPGAIGGSWSTPAYFNNHLYFQGVGDVMRAFLITNGVIVPTPTSVATTSFNALGGTPVVSANGTNNGIVWALQSDAFGSDGPVVLHAYNATNLSQELYNSSQNLTRDNPGAAIKMTTPMVVNGKVVVGGQYTVSIFGNGLFEATPVISPGGGQFTNSIVITMTDATPGAVLYYTLDGTLPNTNSILFSGPFLLTNSALVQAVASAPGAVNSGVASASFINTSAIGNGTGLKGRYWANTTSAAFINVPFTNLPTLTRTDATVNFNWNSVGPDPSIGQTAFVTSWTGCIQPQFNETYTFYATADDGVRVWVNGQLLVDSWVDQAPTTYQGTITLKAQQLYNIRMDYYQNGGGAEAMLAWSSPSTPQAIIPQTQLYPFTNPPPTVVIISPTNNSSYAASASVTINATADAPYNPIRKVDFYSNGNLLGTLSNSPYMPSYVITPTGFGAGNYAFTAVATDGSGLTSTSAVVNITVAAGSGQPYGLTTNGGFAAFATMPTTFLGALPPVLSASGAFANTTNRTPFGGFTPYAPNAAFWSDGAIKSRYFAVPNNGGLMTPDEQIGFTTNNFWTFPAGTVFVKNFDLVVDETNTNVPLRRLETRLIVRDINGAVYGVTYKWRADNSDADLLSSSLSENISITNASGVRTQTWYYPSPADCLTCHTPQAGYVLGVNTRQLNGSLTYPTTTNTDNQLRTLNRLGLLYPAFNETNIAGFTKLAALTNPGASLEVRSRSYLDANCAQCHRPGGANNSFDARFDTPLANQNIVSALASSSLGIDNAHIVQPKDIWRSVLQVRMNTATNLYKMPPLARSLIDSNAVAVVSAWINSLPGIPALAPPTFTPNGGNFAGTVNITLTAPDTNAVIYYTLDGSLPTTNSFRYFGAFNLLNNATISANALETNYLNSAAASARFFIQPMNFTSVNFLPNHQLQLAFSGVTGTTYVLQATTNLVTWTPISTNTALTNVFNFLDANAPNFPYRFYRVLQQ